MYKNFGLGAGANSPLQLIWIRYSIHWFNSTNLCARFSPSSLFYVRKSLVRLTPGWSNLIPDWFPASGLRLVEFLFLANKLSSTCQGPSPGRLSTPTRRGTSCRLRGSTPENNFIIIYSEFQGFRSEVERWLFLSQLLPLLKRALLFEAAGAV